MIMQIRHHLLFYQHAPTRACVAGNSEVRSLSDNVACTASINAVKSLELSGMVNESELLINVVNAHKPKMLRGLNQKVSGQVQRLQRPLTEMLNHRRKGRA